MSGIGGINQKIEINQIEYFLLHQPTTTRQNGLHHQPI